METVELNKYGPIVSSKDVGTKILKDIETKLYANDKIIIDLKGIISMATFCSKQIFGSIYLKLGSEKFFEKIEFKNATNDLKTIIKIGIQSAIEEI